MQSPQQRLEALCARSEHCRSDLEQKLRLWQVEPDEAHAILDRLEQDGFIDSARYARAFANDKHRYNHWGPQRIEAELRQRRIPQADIDSALAQLPQSEQDDTLTRLLRQKLSTVKASTDQELFLKLLRYAAGKGYSYDSAHRCLQEIIANMPAEEGL